MKLKFGMFKKNWVYWLVGGIFLFVVFYLLFSSGGSSNSSGGTTTFSTGPSDAQIAAQTQLASVQYQTQAALNSQQTQANAQVAVAQLAANTQVNQDTLSAQVASLTANLNAQVATAGLSTQEHLASIQAQYGLDTAVVAGQTQLGLGSIQASMFNNQLTANQAMYHDLVTQTTIQSLIGAAQSAPHSDIALGVVGAQITGSAYSRPGSLGGGGVAAGNGLLASGSPTYSTPTYMIGAPSTSLH